LSVVLNTIVPVFAVVGVGFLLAGRRPLDLATLSDTALLVTAPALLFSLLAGSPLEPTRFLTMAGGALFVVAGTAGLAALYSRSSGADLRGLLLPSMLWNAGNMPLPIARLAFGEAGLQEAAVLYVVMATLQSSLGIWIAKGEGGLAEAVRLPLLHAAVAGLLCGALGITLPRIVLEPIEMLGAMAIPLMLLNLGVQLRHLRITDLHHSMAAVVIRMGGGLLLGLAFVTLFDVGGLTRSVLLIHAAMPAAVINGVIAQRYGRSPALVASAIVLGTLASVAVLPLVLYFVL